ncbi:MAG TPA: hypothetical protein PL063_08790 [Candidatus Cloacimonadota bacterium]|nr:hypothetical protein [Candidatus Cloacimonadota bacterium]HQB41816.1 hypothetical protein [Candidatus Cloacimonadota bacterium]
MVVVILVGTNPLPCYLSAMYLIEHYKKKENLNLIFVCTKDNEEKNQTGTDKIAKRIKALIKEKHSKITSRIESFELESRQ